MYVLISLIPLVIALVVAYPILQNLNESKEDDSFGFSLFRRVLKEAGWFKTILIYGGIMSALVISLAPEVMKQLAL